MTTWHPDKERNPVYQEFHKPTYAYNQNRNREQVIRNMYTRLLSELCVNRFKWEGLPTSVDQRYMELMLFRHALSVFYFDGDVNKFFALQGTPSGTQNRVGNPVKFTVTGPMFAGKTLWSKYCVPIWANYFRTPDTDIVAIYAEKLANIDRTIEINSLNARQSRILTATPSKQLSAENINRMIDEGQPVIPVRAEMGEMVQALDMGVHPDTIERMSIVKQRIWAEAMTYLGINNTNRDKKERLVAAEATGNDDEINHFRAVALNARRMAADEINRKYGLAITVEFNSDVSRSLELMDDTVYTDDDRGESWLLSL